MPSSNEIGLAEAERRIAEAKLTGKTVLDLSDLGLEALPESIGRLVQLQRLSLLGNDLTQLPKCVGHLARLESLRLSHNRLTQLPQWIGQLAQLNRLYVNSNQLTRLPESIGQLGQLEELYLHRNQLTQLPESIRQLAQLRRLCLHGNDALNIPAEELGPTRREMREKKGSRKPPHEILDYYFRTRGLAKRPLNEAKLILVGRGGAGKTSLRKMLITGECDKGEDKTPGIAVTPWLLSLDSEKIKLNVWDFGGQENMLATHGYFLTKRSLYVLVINAREGDQDANVEHWLNLVKAYGSGSPALVVVNQCDQHPLDLDERGLREKFPFIGEFVRTDCWEEIGIEKLREAVQRGTDALPDLRTPFPKAWFELKKKLEELPHDCITYDEYKNLCDANEEKDAGNQEVLIGFLNDLGSVLHFSDDPQLCDFGVLKPDWVTQGIYGLLNADSLKAAGAVLKMQDLSTLLDKTRYPRHRHDHLMKLMKKFELCFEMPHTQPSMFLIPELLPKEKPKLPEWKAADALAFEYRYNILPEGLLPRFIVRTHTLSEGCARWRHGVELRQGDAKALVRADVQGRRVWIAVRGPGRQPRDLLAVIRSHFEEIHGGIKGLTAEEKVPVPGYPTVKPLDYRELLVMEARGETEVKIVAASKVVKLPLGRLLDNFEELASRRERATIIVKGDYIEGDKPMKIEDHSIHARDIINSQVSQTMTNCQNMIQQQAPGERRELLEHLEREVGKLISKLPDDQQEDAATNLELLVKGADEKKPNRKWYSVSAEGLLEASKFAKDFAGNIAGTIGQLGKLIWPDFSMPSGEDGKVAGHEQTAD